MDGGWQYVGNLVTCRSWRELWLNEALALFYQQKAVDVAEPDIYYVSSRSIIITRLLSSHRYDNTYSKRKTYAESLPLENKTNDY